MFNSDLAFKFVDTSKNPDISNILHTLEWIFGTPLDQSIDIWSFGCLVYKLLMEIQLFPIPYMS